MRKEIFQSFQIPGIFKKSYNFGSGHIHDTYKVTFDVGGQLTHYLFQKINHCVFPQPECLMDNMAKVVSHLNIKLKSNKLPYVTLDIVPTNTNKFYFQSKNEYWRCFFFIENTYSIDLIEDYENAYEIAKAFAIFQKLLLDFPVQKLEEIIPNFHNPYLRFCALERAIEKDAKQRCFLCQKEIQSAIAKKHIAQVFSQLKLPMRVVHNDTKINNVLLHRTSKKAYSVVDLDLVMPGTILSDFGDLVRSAAGSSEDAGKTFLDLKCYEMLAKGYLEIAKDFLTSEEIENLAISAKIIAYELGLRFLTDYLQGDTYFKTKDPEHNLRRTKTQFSLVEDIEKKESQMKEIINKYLN